MHCFSTNGHSMQTPLLSFDQTGQDSVDSGMPTSETGAHET